MRWDRGHTSPDVVDRRGAVGGGAGGAGLIWLLFSILRSRFGWVGVLIAVGVFFAFGGLSYLTGNTEPRRAGGQEVAGQGIRSSEEGVQFVSFVLDDAQATWRAKFSEIGKPYRTAKLVLFTDRTESGCGFGSAASGPFYCPADERVYIDLSFFRELEQRFGAPGDFAQAYVIAHEIGHHLQTQLGTSERVHRASRGEREGAEGLSVRLELQADCLAGVWANSTKHREILESGDVEEGLGAAAAIGDDRLQRRSTGTVQPESFTHGSSAQRVGWFRRGFEGGRLDNCDTFAAATL